MDALDIFARIVGSPLFVAAAVITAVGASGYVVLTAIRTQQRLVAFMHANGFRWTDTGSTMWLAGVIERWGTRDICGHLDGRWVEVQSHVRRYRCITVTADRDLVSGQVPGVVSLGAWTRPKPPALLEGMRLDAAGRQLRVFVGGGDFVPYIVAAVAYAKTLEEHPVDPDPGRSAG